MYNRLELFDTGTLAYMRFYKEVELLYIKGEEGATENSSSTIPESSRNCIWHLELSGYLSFDARLFSRLITIRCMEPMLITMPPSVQALDLNEFSMYILMAGQCVGIRDVRITCERVVNIPVHLFKYCRALQSLTIINGNFVPTAKFSRFCPLLTSLVIDMQDNIKYNEYIQELAYRTPTQKIYN